VPRPAGENPRHGFLHKQSTRLVEGFGIIATEALEVAKMTRSAKSTVQEPGTNVKQKAGLNRAAWRTVVHGVDLKVRGKDVFVVEVNDNPSLHGGYEDRMGGKEIYRRESLGRMYADIAPHDPDGILRDDFLNSRGAIPRFGRGSIEIRVLDVQKSPAADLAIAALTVGASKLLTEEVLSSFSQQASLEVPELASGFLECIRDGDHAVVENAALLGALGMRASRASVGRSCNLLLNVPPDRRGRFLENDVQALRDFRRIPDGTIATDLPAGVVSPPPGDHGGPQAPAPLPGCSGRRRQDPHPGVPGPAGPFRLGPTQGIPGGGLKPPPSTASSRPQHGHSASAPDSSDLKGGAQTSRDPTVTEPAPDRGATQILRRRISCHHAG
jgi:hypothetical protein